jgi:hypothetical protein
MEKLQDRVAAADRSSGVDSSIIGHTTGGIKTLK